METGTVVVDVATLHKDISRPGFPPYMRHPNVRIPSD